MVAYLRRQVMPAFSSATRSNSRSRSLQQSGASRSCLSPASLAVIMLAACLSAMCLGCGSEDEAAQQTPTTNPDLAAQDILQNARAAYRSASTYADRGEFVLRYQLEGQQRQEKHPFELAFRRSNEMHLRVFNASLLSDGHQMAFAVNDPSTNHMDQQVIVRSAESTIPLVPIKDDPIASFFIAGGAEIPLDKKVEAPQVELAHPALALLVGSSEPTWFGAAKDAERIKDRELDNQSFYRVRITSTLGNYIVWVDPSTWLIRRLEFPLELLDPELSQSPLVANLQMFADLREARIDEGFADAAFAIQLPQSARRVRQFVSLPEPFPSELVGKAPRAFELNLLGGKTLTSDDLAGKTTVLLWFSSESVCRSAVEEFGRVRKLMGDASNLQLIAVGTDPATSLSDVELMQQVRDWGCQEVVARADHSIGLGTFDIRALPTLIVINDEGIVQFYRTIENGKLATELVTVVRRLEKGDNIAAEMRADYRKYLDQYEQQIANAGPNRAGANREGAPEVGPRDTPDPSFTTVSAAAVPQGLEFISLWKRDGFVSAGNILAGTSNSAPSFSVMDGFRTVVQLNASGEEIRRTSLQLPEGVAVTWLKHMPDSTPARYLGGSVLAQQLFGFDDNWNPVVRYPSQASAPHAGIRDVAIHREDLRDGLLTIGYWQEMGIASLDARGKSLQANSQLPQVNSVVESQTTSGETRFYVASNDGLIRVLNDALEIVSEQALDNLSVTHMFANENFTSSSEPQARFVALAPQDATTTLAVGLDDNLKTIWQQPISATQFSNEIQFVVPGEIDGVGRIPASERRCWAIARPDGTVHLIAADGSWAKQLTLGFSPTGIAFSRIRGQSVLLIANDRTVQCWQIRRAAEVSRKTED